MSKFKAFLVTENENKYFQQDIVERNIDDLPIGELLVRVKYSSLNYKDALSSIGNKGVSRNFPHTPGIDAFGIVEICSTEDFKPGDQVLITGFDLGMNTSGGFGEYIRIPAKWAIKLPQNLTPTESMILGTAGLTAGLCIDKLIENGSKPENGKVIVTGATGGVGTLAVMILAKLGYHVVAVSGKKHAHEFLYGIGAKEIISRDEVSDNSSKPLLKGIYAACVDTVGGNILTTILKSMQYNGLVSICGLVQSPELHTSVFPFILRGISLFGIDSSECSLEWRKKVWQKLSEEWKPDHLESISKIIALEELPQEINKILKGEQIGRTVVKLSSEA